MRPIWIIVALVVAIGCSGPVASVPASRPPATSSPSIVVGDPRPVIIDTDMAADDWLAILYLVKRPEVEVVAVTVTGTGEAHCAPGVRNALALLALAGQPDIPVACGRETPIAGSNAFPDDWRQAVDDLLGIEIPDGEAAPSDDPAPELLEAILGDATDPVTLLVLGPVTNVAELLDASSSAAGKIAGVYVMGGAVDVGGNVGASGVGIENQSAEWNVYCDPVAAKTLLDSGVPVTLVPLDATNDAPVTPAFQQRLVGDATTPEARFVSQVLAQQTDAIAAGYNSFWDPLAAAVLVDEGLTTLETRNLSVETTPGPDEGRIIAAPDGQPVRFAMSADAATFEQHFLDTLNGRP